MNTKMYVAAATAVLTIAFVAAMPDTAASPFMGTQVEGFEGSVTMPEYVTPEDVMDARHQITVSLSEAAEGRDVVGGFTNVVTGQDDQNFLVWYLIGIDEDYTTMTLHIIDVTDVNNYVVITNEIPG